jgi:diguanylate cyclase (GGDEF)-like protein
MKLGPAVPPLSPEQNIELLIRADKLKLLYQQSFQAVFLSLASALILAAILWSHTGRGVLLGWLIALGISSLLRLALFTAYRRTGPEGLELARNWARPYLITLMTSSAVWGLGGVWIMPPDSLLNQTIVFYFLMGMTSGAISVYSAIRPFAIATMVVVLLPATLWMLSRGELTPVLMGVAAFLPLIAAVRATKVLSDSLTQNYLLAHELQQSKDKAECLARTDALTGLKNRRAFIELADKSVRFCQRHHLPASAIVLDIDRFKAINDSRGHSVGDQALQHIAHLLQTCIRSSDICARIGGEEFAVLLPDTELVAAVQVAEKIRQAIIRHPVRTEDGPLLITASLGVGCSDEALDHLLQLADTAMYQAKQAGRNRVFCCLGIDHSARPVESASS